MAEENQVQQVAMRENQVKQENQVQQVATRENQVKQVQQENLQQVTTKDPKKVEAGKRLAEYNHKKRKEQKSEVTNIMVLKLF